MGRKKIDDEKKKVKIGISIDPELPGYFKDRSINISSLINKLLKEYVENGRKQIPL
jgi:post-segregation antitoxin (ccd killing protein)